MTASNGVYVQYGAGFISPPGWINFDVSPTLRVQTVPVVGRVLAKLSGNANAFPEGISYGDIRRGLPVAAGSVDGLYASHVLEHLALEDMRVAVRNSFALLKSGGVFRLIVPDLLERARRYVAQADGGAKNASHAFMHSTYLGQETRPSALLSRIRAAVGNSAHLWMWDFASLKDELEQAGFSNVRRASLGDSGDPMFDRVEHPSRFTDDGITEVAVEARRA